MNKDCNEPRNASTGVRAIAPKDASRQRFPHLLIACTRPRRLLRKLLFVLSLLALFSPAHAETIQVVLMGGQSNMEGTGVTAQAPAHLRSQPELRLYHSASLKGAHPPNRWNPLGPASFAKGKFGPELAAGFQLSQDLGTKKLALIKHAEGGTKLTPKAIGYETTSWYPGADKSDTAHWGKEFTIFVQTVERGLEELKAQGLSPEIIGMFWVQGEADATDIQAGAEYGKNLTLLIKRVREQFDVPDLPFVYAQVLPYQKRASSAEVRQAMADIDQDSGKPEAIPGAFMVATEGMKAQGDKVHFNTGGQLALGRKLAQTLARRGLGISPESNKTIEKDH